MNRAGWRSPSKKLAVGLLSCAAIFGIAAAMMSTPAANVALADEETPEQVTMVSDFTDRGMGLYPDIQENGTYINAGNRGCAACHTDLFDLDKDNGTYTHITTYVGLKDATYNGDCIVCHNISTGTAGNTMSENIHIAHYSSDAFVAANGNCWSCHLMTRNQDGDNIFTMYEDVMYDAAFGGYPGAATYSAATDQTWAKRRGFDSGFMSGVSVTSEPALDVTLDQAPNAEDAEFLIENYLRIDGNDTYATIDPATWSLEVIIDGESTMLSLDDIKAMPVTEYNGAQWCLVCGYNTAMIDNMPMKGVLLSDFVEQLGIDPAVLNTISLVSVDEWTAIMPIVDVTFADGSSLIAGQGSLQSYIDANSMLVYENYGHDLTVAQGAPVKLFVPGTGGTITVKNLVGMEFSTTDEPATIDGICEGFVERGVTIPINSSWFDNDGVEAKVGEPLVLEGASYGWSVGTVDNHLAKVEFSLDYGQTWTEFEVPADFDPDQWVHYTVSWTPEQAGTYIMKVRAVDFNGVVQQTESSIIVNVAE